MFACLAVLCLVVIPSQQKEATFEGQPAVFWIKLLRDRQSDERKDAIHALSRIGPDAAPLLIEAMKHEDAYMRSGAARAVRGRPEIVIPALIALLTDDNLAEKQMHEGATYFGKLIGHWQNLVEDKDKETSRLARNAVRDLSSGWPSPSPRPAAVEALGNYGPQAKAAVPALLKALKSEHGDIRYLAARALARIDLNDSTIFAAIVSAYGRTSYSVTRDEFGNSINAEREEVFEIINRMREGAAPALIEALGNEDDTVRRNAAILLGKIGSYGEAAIPALKKASRDESREVREAAKATVEKLTRTQSKSPMKKKKA